MSTNRATLLKKVLWRILSALAIGGVLTLIAVMVVRWSHYWGLGTPLNFQSYAFRELKTADTTAGFEHIVGYDKPQAFYWSEIVYSKEYKLEVLRQLGETPQSRYGLLDQVSAEVREPLYQYFFEESEPRRRDGLYLILYFIESAEPVTESTYLVAEFEAYERAFIEVLKRRNVEAKPVGEITFRSLDTLSWRVLLPMHGLEFFLIGFAASLVTSVFSLRRSKLGRQRDNSIEPI
jgi:hypothetical protein